MRNVLAIALAASLMLVAGCANKESKIVGKWKPNIELPASVAKSPMASKILDSVAAVRFEFKSDHSFAITGAKDMLTNKPVPDGTGTWSLKDNTVTITPSKAADSKSAGAGPAKAMDCTLSEDGKTLIPSIPAGQASQGKFTLVKES